MAPPYCNPDSRNQECKAEDTTSALSNLEGGVGWQGWTERSEGNPGFRSFLAPTLPPPKLSVHKALATIQRALVEVQHFGEALLK
jgi:hypothetical protein